MYTQEEDFYSTLLIASIIIGIIILYFLYSVIINNKREKELRNKMMYNEINAIENVRKRIAQNLHDSIGPELAVLKFELDDLQTQHDDDRTIIKRVKQSIDEIIADTRSISHNLMPSSLLKLGLIASISEFSKKINSSNLKIIVLNDSYPKLDLEKEVHLYRIFEEIIYNTLKHANATKLSFLFQHKDNSVVITTRDNGVGFEMNKIGFMESGIGLNNIKFRAELLGGKLEIHSEKNKGVEIIINIPVN